MLSVTLGLGLTVGFLYVYRLLRRGEAQLRSFCRIHHRVGSITVRHYDVISCTAAKDIGKAAEMVWRLLEEPLPLPAGRQAGQPDNFILEVILDPKRLPGTRRGDRVTVNLYDCTHGAEILDTLAEELHHLREAWAGIEPEFIFHPPLFWNHRDVVRYYALNPHEYRALCFAVSLVSVRKRLLEEVEEYRALHGIE